MVSHVPTLPDTLADAGYRTRAIGKLHLTPMRAPASQGFEESLARWQKPEMEAWHGPYYWFDHVDLALGHGENVTGHYRYWLDRAHPEVATALRSGTHRQRRPFPELSDL